MKTMICPDCGSAVNRTGARQTRCKSCSIIHERQSRIEREGRHPCSRCGKLISLKYRACRSCSATINLNRYRDLNPGQGFISKDGYRCVPIRKDDFFHPMANSRDYIFEHRLVMAKHLGRNLHRWELVHHKHTKYPKGSIEDKQDNRIGNLQLVSDDRHNQITILENRIQFLEQRVTMLEAENILLKQQTVRFGG